MIKQLLSSFLSKVCAMPRTRSQQRRRKTNIMDSIYKFFVKGKFCFLFIGFVFGLILSRCLEWSNFRTEYEMIDLQQNQPIVIDTKLKQTKSPTKSSALISNNKDNKRIELDDPLLKGLENGMKLIAKNPINSGKKVRLLYIIGNEGSGHHLWQSIMEDMNKHSKKINTDYIENEILLTELLHSCFMEIYHSSKSQLHNKYEREYKDKAAKTTEFGYFVDYSCNAFKTELSKLVKDDNILPNESLMYLRSFSYPFMGTTLDKIPNIVRLLTIVQEIPEIDMKFILMKREWINTIVSACVHRFGECETRVNIQSPILSIIQSQILSIDPKCWIMIDYEDFVQRPLQYVDIINDYLLINDKTLIENSIKEIVKPSKTSSKSSGWQEMRTKSPNLADLVDNMMYKPWSNNMWPIYDSPYFLVSPENRQFLDSKYK